MSTAEKLDLISRIDNAYMREFGFDRHNIKQLNNRYRSLRQNISNAIELKELEFNTIKLTIAQRNCSISKLKLDKYKNLNIPAYLHMMMNRFFASNNRLNEMVIYNYLTRYYKSVIARGREQDKDTK